MTWGGRPRLHRHAVNVALLCLALCMLWAGRGFHGQAVADERQALLALERDVVALVRCLQIERGLVFSLGPIDAADRVEQARAATDTALTEALADGRGLQRQRTKRGNTRADLREAKRLLAQARILAGGSHPQRAFGPYSASIRTLLRLSGDLLLSALPAEPAAVDGLRTWLAVTEAAGEVRAHGGSLVHRGPGDRELVALLSSLSRYRAVRKLAANAETMPTGRDAERRFDEVVDALGRGDASDPSRRAWFATATRWIDAMHRHLVERLQALQAGQRRGLQTARIETLASGVGALLSLLLLSALRLVRPPARALPSAADGAADGRPPGRTRRLFWAVCLGLIAAVPALPLLWGGADLATTPPDPALLQGLSGHGLMERVHQLSAGAFVHTLLEWTAVVLAFTTATLALVHYRATRDPLMPVFGYALGAAGLVDAFHILATDRLITATADNRDFIPFTWVISRMFHALVLLAGTLLVRRRAAVGNPPYSTAWLLGVGALFSACAYGIVTVAAVSGRLPPTLFPDAVITRPIDLVPVPIFALVILMLLRIRPSGERAMFVDSMVLGCIAAMVTGLLIAFGSSQLFDAYFNVAHATKCLAYSIPLAGLALDYIRAFEKERAFGALARTTRALEQEVQRREVYERDLKRSNTALAQFAYVASHDLQTPLRALQDASGRLLEKRPDGEQDEETQQLLGFIQTHSRRAAALVRDILSYSRADPGTVRSQDIDLGQLCCEVLEPLQDQLADAGAQLSVDPGFVVSGDRVQYSQLIQNLVGNALKYRDPDRPPRIQVQMRQLDGQRWQLAVADNGIGIRPEHQGRIFDMFQRLHSRKKYEGTGVGLALCKRIVDNHAGAIEVKSEEGKGATFCVTLPVHPHVEAQAAE